jgi:hypothetical protein
VPGGRARRRGATKEAERLFEEIMTHNFSNMIEDKTLGEL